MRISRIFGSFLWVPCVFVPQESISFTPCPKPYKGIDRYRERISGQHFRMPPDNTPRRLVPKFASLQAPLHFGPIIRVRSLSAPKQCLRRDLRYQRPWPDTQCADVRQCPGSRRSGKRPPVCHRRQPRRPCWADCSGMRGSPSQPSQLRRIERSQA